MFRVDDNQITLTQGDSCSFEVTIYTQNADTSSRMSLEDNVYVMEEGDKLKFIVLDINQEGISNSIFKNVYNQYVYQNYSNLTKPPVLMKEFTDNVIDIQSNDLNFVNTGVYLYGIVLVTKDGYVNTIQQGRLILQKGFV